MSIKKSQDGGKQNRANREPSVVKRRKPGVVARFVLRNRPSVLGARYLCQLRPAPLIDPDRKLVLIWSPKSACTAAIIWFYKFSGLYDEAHEYDPWPHQYRQNVFYGSETYRRALGDDLRDYKVLRVIRDPFQRAISSYRHALMSGHLDKSMSAHLKRPASGEAGYSFAEFLGCIGQKDLSVFSSNTHHAVQSHPLERVIAPTHVINVSKSDLFAELNAFEASIGAEQTVFDALGWLQETSKGSRHRKTGAHGGDVSTTVFTRKMAARGPWPESSELLSEAIRGEIRRLYAVDFENYAAFL